MKLIELSVSEFYVRCSIWQKPFKAMPIISIPYGVS